MTEAELQFLLAQSRNNNEADNVTGMLLYLEGRFLTNVEGRFMQLLEGPAIAVAKVFKTIKADDRHANVIILKQGQLAERLFEKWNMGFKRVHADQTENIPGFFNVTAAFLDEHIAPEKHEVLDFFRSFYTINN